MKQDPTQLRKEVRYECVGLIDVYELKNGRQLACGSGLLEDISASGACVRMDQAVEIGTRLLLKSRTQQVEAMVRNCRAEGTVFLMGLEFMNGFRWKPAPTSSLPPAQPSSKASAPKVPSSAQGASQPAASKVPPAEVSSTPQPKLSVFRETLHRIASAHRSLRLDNLTRNAPPGTPPAEPGALQRAYWAACEDFAGPVVILELTGRIKFANEEFRARFTVEDGDFASCVAREDLAEIASTITAASAEPGKTRFLRLRLRGGVGNVHQVRTCWKASSAGQHIVVSLLHSFPEDEHRAGMEAELALRTVIDRETGMGTWNWDLTLARVECLEECRNLLGLGTEDMRLAYDHFRELIHPEDRSLWDAAASNCIAKGTAIHVSTRIVSRKGFSVNVQCRGTVVRGEDGRPARIAGVFIPVSDAAVPAGHTLPASDDFPGLVLRSRAM